MSNNKNNQIENDDENNIMRLPYIFNTIHNNKERDDVIINNNYDYIRKPPEIGRLSLTLKRSSSNNTCEQNNLSKSYTFRNKSISLYDKKKYNNDFKLSCLIQSTFKFINGISNNSINKINQV